MNRDVRLHVMINCVSRQKGQKTGTMDIKNGRE